jgi:hypothetical protein
MHAHRVVRTLVWLLDQVKLLDNPLSHKNNVT